MSKDNDSLDKEIEDLKERERKYERTLGNLLEELTQKQDFLFASVLRMGGVPSYIAVRNLEWVAAKVKFMATMPIYNLEDVVAEAHQIKVNERTVDFLFQREIDWSRQADMTEYLAGQKEHKFPPLLVVAYQEWIKDMKPKDKAKKESIDFTPIGGRCEFCRIDTTKTSFFVIDGQHRLMAILGLNELLANGHLLKKKKDGKPMTSSAIDRETLIDEINRKFGEDPTQIRSRLNSLMQETIGIEIIPMVLKSETWETAARRLRTSFVDVNKNAKQTTHGEELLLQDKNGYVIAAKNLMVTHDLLSKGRTDVKQPNLTDASTKYTTLDALAKMSTEFLGQQDGFIEWKFDPSVRPTDGEISRAIATLKGFFDGLASLPSHQRFLRGAPAQTIRGILKDRGKDDHESNILFHPIAQKALAAALGTLVKEKGDSALKSAMQAISQKEKEGMLSLTSHNSPWFGVLCDPIRMTMRKHKEYQILCRDMLHYLLGGGLQEDEPRERLRERFASARKCSVGDDTEAIFMDLNGEKVQSKNVDLPTLWR